MVIPWRGSHGRGYLEDVPESISTGGGCTWSCGWGPLYMVPRRGVWASPRGVSLSSRGLSRLVALVSSRRACVTSSRGAHVFPSRGFCLVSSRLAWLLCGLVSWRLSRLVVFVSSGVLASVFLCVAFASCSATCLVSWRWSMAEVSRRWPVEGGGQCHCEIFSYSDYFHS